MVFILPPAPLYLRGGAASFIELLHNLGSANAMIFKR